MLRVYTRVVDPSHARHVASGRELSESPAMHHIFRACAPQRPDERQDGRLESYVEALRATGYVGA